MSGSRQELILEAAIQLFHERGYHATGVDDIGEAVDVSGPAIYRHYASKEEILVDAIERAADEVHAANQSARSEERKPRALMEQYVRAFTRVAIDEAALIAVWVSEVRHLTPDRRSTMTRRIRSWTEEWVEALIDWRPELTPSEARLLVAGAIGLITTVPTAVEPTADLVDQITIAALSALDAPV
jgi:AcrR family transcriptional regulator